MVVVGGCVGGYGGWWLCLRLLCWLWLWLWLMVVVVANGSGCVGGGNN